MTGAVHPLALMNIDSPCDALEKRTFEFFRSQTAPSVSGYFQDAVWNRIVLQVSQSEPTVRCAVNAVAALHETIDLRKNMNASGHNNTLVTTDFPAKQYAKALDGLRTILSSADPSPDVVLICALLFIHFEALRENYVPALVHIQNANKLLQSTSDWSARTADQNLVRAIQRVDLQASVYIGIRAPASYDTLVNNALPARLSSLNDARNLVDTWSSRMLQFLRVTADNYKLREPSCCPLEVIAESHSLVATFTELDRLLLDFMHAPGTKMSLREQHGLAGLRSKIKVNRFTSATCIYSEETTYDAHMRDFEDILTICGNIMEQDGTDKVLFSVMLDEGLLHPIFQVAVKCRKGVIRHRAMALLRQLPAGEGNWHVAVMTWLASRIVAMEEEGLEGQAVECEAVPEWKRFHSAGLTGFKDDSSPHVNCIFRRRPNGMDGEWEDVHHRF